MDEHTLGEIEVRGDFTAKTWFEKMANAASSRSSRSVSPSQRQNKKTPQQLAVINGALTARKEDNRGAAQSQGLGVDLMGTARGSLQGSVHESIGSKGSFDRYTTTTIKSKTPFSGAAVASAPSSPLRGNTPAGSVQGSLQGSLSGRFPSPSFKPTNVQTTGNPLRKASTFMLPIAKKPVITASYKRKRRFQLPTVFAGGSDGPALPAIRGHVVLRFSVARPSAVMGHPTEAMVATERRLSS